MLEWAKRIIGMSPVPVAAGPGYADALGAWAIQVEWVNKYARPLVFSPADVRQTLTAYLPAGSNITLGDGQYAIPNAMEFDHLRTGSPLPTIPYAPDRRDCDDYARYFSAACAIYCRLNNVAVIWDLQAEKPNGMPYPHAYNLVIMADKQGKLFCRGLEPQTMRWIWPGTDGLLVKPLQARL